MTHWVIIVHCFNLHVASSFDSGQLTEDRPYHVKTIGSQPFGSSCTGNSDGLGFQPFFYNSHPYFYVVGMLFHDYHICLYRQKLKNSFDSLVVSSNKRWPVIRWNMDIATFITYNLGSISWFFNHIDYICKCFNWCAPVQSPEKLPDTESSQLLKIRG